MAIALGLIFFAGSGQAQQEAHGGQGQTDQQENPAQTLPIPFPVDIVEDQAAAETRQRREEESAQREIDDLAAQQGMNAATQAMNDATQRMAKYALWSTGLVGLGTALLFVTLYLTWQANRAAVAAVEVTRSVGEAQVRAYLSFDHIKIIPTFGADKTLIHVVFRPFIKNTGQTPAHIERMNTVLFVMIANQDIRETQIRPATTVGLGNDSLVKHDLGAGGFYFMRSQPVDLVILQQAFAGTHRIFVCGLFQYRDVFTPNSPVREETFCHEMVPINDPAAIKPDTTPDDLDRTFEMRAVGTYEITARYAD